MRKVREELWRTVHIVDDRNCWFDATWIWKSDGYSGITIPAIEVRHFVEQRCCFHQSCTNPALYVLRYVWHHVHHRTHTDNLIHGPTRSVPWHIAQLYNYSTNGRLCIYISRAHITRLFMLNTNWNLDQVISDSDPVKLASWNKVLNSWALSTEHWAIGNRVATRHRSTGHHSPETIMYGKVFVSLI